MLRAYVSDIRHREIVVRNGAPILQDASLFSGVVSVDAHGSAVIPFSSETDLARILEALRDRGVAFAGSASGWPPSEVFADLRERGAASGRFDELMFRGPNQPIVRSK